MTDTVSLEAFNPFSEQVQQCPHLYYEAMRRETPAFQVPGTDIYMVTRHDLISPIARDTSTFSSDFSTAGQMPSREVIERIKAVMADGWPQVPTMLTIDPPHHTRFRGTVATYFTPKQMTALRPAVETIVDRLIAAVPDGEFDFVTALAVPIPIETIAAVLNVPNDRLDDFKRWSDDSIAPIGSNISDDRRVEAMAGIVEFQRYFAEQLEDRRIHPVDDLMTSLVQAEIDIDEEERADHPSGKRPLTMAEMLSIVQQLLVAGNETTTKALTEGIMLLAQHPAVWADLLADPEGYAPAVTEEVLRLATPTQGMFRTVTVDTEIGGVPVPAGSRLVLVYSAANRDPEVWGDDPDGFDPGRDNLKQHVAFGKGIHFCLGAPLSRLEMNVAFERIAKAFDKIELGANNDFRYHPSFMLRGLVRLDVAMRRAS
jgi:cytochrome P450